MVLATALHFVAHPFWGRCSLFGAPVPFGGRGGCAGALGWLATCGGGLAATLHRPHCSRIREEDASGRTGTSLKENSLRT